MTDQTSQKRDWLHYSVNGRGAAETEMITAYLNEKLQALEPGSKLKVICKSDPGNNGVRCYRFVIEGNVGDETFERTLQSLSDALTRVVDPHYLVTPEALVASDLPPHREYAVYIWPVNTFKVLSEASKNDPEIFQRAFEKYEAPILEAEKARDRKKAELQWRAEILEEMLRNGGSYRQ